MNRDNQPASSGGSLLVQEKGLYYAPEDPSSWLNLGVFVGIE